MTTGAVCVETLDRTTGAATCSHGSVVARDVIFGARTEWHEEGALYAESIAPRPSRDPAWPSSEGELWRLPARELARSKTIVPAPGHGRLYAIASAHDVVRLE